MNKKIGQLDHKTGKTTITRILAIHIQLHNNNLGV